MAAPTGEKSILLQVCKAKGRDLQRRNELWFIVKHTANGIKVEEIFKDLPSDKRKICFLSSCALVGSFLYVLGGQIDASLCGTICGSPFSRRVRRLNIRDPTEGWESCGRLPCELGPATVGVAGNFIYLFSASKKKAKLQCGCFYDTTNQRGHVIEHAPDCSDCKSLLSRRSRRPRFGRGATKFCAAFDNGPESRGVIAPRFRKYTKFPKHLYLYNPDKKSWKNICNFKFPKRRFPFYPEYAVFSDKLYLSFCDWRLSGANIYLYVYDIRTGQSLLDIRLPRFENLDPVMDGLLHLVAIADCKLCYLWHGYRMDKDKAVLFLVKIDVFINERSVSCSQMEVDLDMDAFTIVNCLPFDSYADENEEENAEVKEKPDDTGFEQTNSQWSPRRCHDVDMDEKLSLLEAETQRLCEGYECLQKEVQQLRALITSEDKDP